MPLQINGKNIGGVYRSTPIAEAYRGSTLVWQNVPKVTIEKISDVWTKIKESNNFPRNDGRYWTRDDRLVTGVPNWNEYPLQEVPYRLVLAPGFTNAAGMFSSYYSGSWTPENKLVTAPKMDTSRLTDMTGFFWNAVRLETVPEYTITANTSLKDFAANCPKLKGLVLRDCGKVQDTKNLFGGEHDPSPAACTRVELHGIGPSLPSGHVLDLSRTALTAEGATALFASLGTVTSGRTVTLKLPDSALGARQGVARGKGWTVTPFVDDVEVVITGTSDTQARDSFRAAITARGLDYKTIKSVPFFLDTSQVTNMSSMFLDCSSLTSVPDMDTSNVTDMRSMFFNCSSLTSVPDLNTSNVTGMRTMFYGCSSLTSVPDMDTGNVTTMNGMFNKCAALTSVPDMNTSNVTDMYNMFFSCSSLTSVPDMNTSNVTDMSYMFYGCAALKNGNARCIGKKSGVNTSSMIANSGLTRLPFYDANGNWTG